MDNRAAATAFAEWQRAKRGAPASTLEKYRRLALGWANFLPTPLAERTPEDVEAFYGRPRRGNTEAAPATVANELAVLSSFHQWGMARLAWPANPAKLAGRPKVRNRNPRPVDDATWMRVWQSDLPIDARVAMGLGFYCGLRRAEVTRLRGDQVWGGALVNFIRKGQGEDRFDYTDVLEHWQRTMPALEPMRLLEPLRSLAHERGPVALMPWAPWNSPKALNRRMVDWLCNSDLGSAAFTPHQLRHSFATNLLRTGVPLEMACELCNHSSVVVTMRYIKTAGGRLASLNRPTLAEVG